MDLSLGFLFCSIFYISVFLPVPYCLDDWLSISKNIIILVVYLLKFNMFKGNNNFTYGKLLGFLFLNNIILSKFWNHKLIVFLILEQRISLVFLPLCFLCPNLLLFPVYTSTEFFLSVLFKHLQFIFQVFNDPLNLH